jgi:hypothetical protein
LESVLSFFLKLSKELKKKKKDLNENETKILKLIKNKVVIKLLIDFLEKEKENEEKKKDEEIFEKYNILKILFFLSENKNLITKKLKKFLEEKNKKFDVGNPPFGRTLS